MALIRKNGSMRRLTISQARRIALHAQGFADAVPKGRIDARHFRRVVRRTGVVQLDSVNVLARAHYMPFFSRLGPYRQDALDRWLWRSGEMFEYWAHAASLVPTRHRPLFVHRMRTAAQWNSVERLHAEQPGFIEAVMEEVRKRGPVTSSDLGTSERRTDPWWGWKPEKHALEWLFFNGSLTAADRVNFAKTYDLPERVHAPEILAAEAPQEDTARKMLLLLSARSHGIGTVHDLADYYRIRARDARPVLDQAVRDGVLEEVEVDSWEGPVYLHPSAVTPRSVVGASLLSPFDPLVWYRDRTERLFGFHYRIEIYVPAPQRQYGYYVLPFLLDGDLVGRVDLKADRKRNVLMVRGSFADDGHDPTKIAPALAAELRSMAEWLELVDIEVEKLGNLASLLRKHVQ